MQKMLFIMNPFAGQRKVNKYLPEIISLYNQAGFEVTTYMTTGVGNGTQIVENRAKDFDLVVCAGGDGTLNEVVTGLMRSGARCPIGYIPCGSTNDFAASMKISTNVMHAAMDILSGVPMPHDVGRFNDRYFCYVASCGAFTRSSYTTPQNVKNALGHLAYVLDSIQEIPQIRKTHMRLEFGDEVVEDDFIFGAISNSLSIGGVLTLDPNQVDMGDGKFEILLVRLPKDANELRECIRALGSQKYDCRAITFREVSRLTIQQDEPITWTLDGERCDSNRRIEVENLHHAVHFLLKQEEA